jgi:hypothetical protein
MIAPELATGDGALGFWKALREACGTTREQRCWVHKTAPTHTSAFTRLVSLARPLLLPCASAPNLASA